MAKILVVDDSWPNCQYLVKLLGYGNHQLLEAADGAEALDKVKAEHPDLIISDIFMPTMDGFEFVRRLRSDPTTADTPVVLYTATYHVSQVKDLADACGIHHVLEKPARPEVILEVVEKALGNGPSPVQPLPPDQFEQERLRLLTGKLSERNEALGNRLAALIELNLELSAQRDLRLLLKNFCGAARAIIGSKYAVAGVSDGSASDIFTSGMVEDTASCFTGFTPARNPLGKLLRERRPCFRADLKSASLVAEE